MILAIDPGLATGWCLMREDGVLVDAGLGDPPVSFDGTTVVIEKPQVYPRAPTPPNDLITLAIQVGRYTERYESRGCSVEHILPHTWKGSLRADICIRRVWHALSDADKAVLSPKILPLARKPLTEEFLDAGTRHNVLDAVGLARWSLRRARAGVF